MYSVKQGESCQMRNWGRCFSLFSISSCFISFLYRSKLNQPKPHRELPDEQYTKLLFKFTCYLELFVCWVAQVWHWQLYYCYRVENWVQTLHKQPSPCVYCIRPSIAGLRYTALGTEMLFAFQSIPNPDAVATGSYQVHP